MDQLVRGLRAGPFGRDVKLGDRCDSVPRSIWVRCRIRLPRTSQMMMVGVLILGLADEFARIDVLCEAKAKCSKSMENKDSPLRET